MPEVLLSIREKLSKLSYLNNLLSHASELGLVREAHKHYCLNRTLGVKMLVVKAYLAPNVFIYIICPTVLL